MNSCQRIDEVYLKKFLKYSKDKNPIHQNKQAIIPGNLLLLLLEEKYTAEFKKELKAVNVTFLKPVFVNQKLKFDISKKFFKVFSDEQIVLQGEFKD